MSIVTEHPSIHFGIAASLARQGFHVERPESELVISNEWLGKMLRLACEEAGRETEEKQSE